MSRFEEGPALGGKNCKIMLDGRKIEMIQESSFVTHRIRLTSYHLTSRLVLIPDLADPKADSPSLKDALRFRDTKGRCAIRSDSKVPLRGWTD